MKWFKEENNKLVAPPINDPVSGVMNCNLNIEWLEANGYTQWTDEQISEWEQQHPTEFDIACQHFREVCAQIGELLDIPDFRGGYDDMTTFYENPAYQTDKGLQLAIAWSGCNDLCRYEASKIGLGSPAWWKKCWEQKAEL